MLQLVHQSIYDHALSSPDAIAMCFKQQVFSYKQMQLHVSQVAAGLLDLGILAGERVATYLPKQPETVFGIFGSAAAGAAFVPINPLLKPRQVGYILGHCNVRVLITSSQRLQLLGSILGEYPQLQTVIVVEDTPPTMEECPPQNILAWQGFVKEGYSVQPHTRIDIDMVAILYTSGSTGNPKGVVLSHRNMVAGADSVASYLGNTSEDCLLAALPLSFDAGLSQLTTAFSVGASVVLMDYLLPQDVIRAVSRYKITGLAGVPTLWNQLASLKWPKEASESLRYITNTGGAMPRPTTKTLQKILPSTKIFLMYGLTEAFRSTYLPPDQVNKRPDSIGKAIPNAQILVVDENGVACKPGEPGELVHRGTLVAMGYWNDAEKTAERFKPCPGHPDEFPIMELAVWSGDQVVMDEEGYLYFISRKDELIKTSGYRVSPTEVEECAYDSGHVAGAAALGLPHPKIGEAIALIVTMGQKESDAGAIEAAIMSHCRKELPNFMVPLEIVIRESLPLNQNGKIDRRALRSEYLTIFQETNT